LLAYTLKQLRALRMKIVYANLSEDDWYLMKPGVAHATKFAYSERSPSQELDGDTWYLADTGKKAKRTLHASNAFTVVAASPQSAAEIRGFGEEQGYLPSIYTPVWSLEELLQCRLVAAPTAEEKKLEDAQWTSALLPTGTLPTATAVGERFKQYGGIARVALADDAKFAELMNDLERAYQECDLDKVVKSLGTDLRLLPGTSSWLLHYVVDEDDFSLDSIRFASAAILQRVWELHQGEKRDSILRFINETSHNPKWRSAGGDLFETYVAPTLLQQGGSFEVHKLVDPLTKKKADKNRREDQTGQLVLPASALVVVPLNAAADIRKMKPGQYGDQSTGQLETIDGALRPSPAVQFIVGGKSDRSAAVAMLLFQFAVGDSHDVKVNGLLQAIHATAPKRGESVRFYFVVPPHQFARFKVGTFEDGIDEEGNTVGEADIPEGIEFWVLQAYMPAAPPLIGTPHTHAVGAAAVGAAAATSSKKRKAPSAAAAAAAAEERSQSEEEQEAAGATGFAKKQKKGQAVLRVACQGVCGQTFEGAGIQSMLQCTSVSHDELFAVCGECKKAMVLRKSDVVEDTSWFHPSSHEKCWKPVT
jgi:hypothetical protein